MKIEFINDTNLMRLFYMHQFIRSSGSMARTLLSYPLFFNDEMKIIAKVYSRFIYDQKAFENAFHVLMETGETNGKGELLGYLEKFDIPFNSRDPKSTSSLNARILGCVKTYEKQMQYWVNKIFGFSLPDRYMVIADTNNDIHGHLTGSYIGRYKDTPIVGFLGPGIGPEDTDIVDVILHELLHAAIRENEVNVPKIALGYEEALLDYFCPYGILSKKIGLIDRYEVNEDHRLKVGSRPYTSRESDNLLKSLTKYINLLQKNSDAVPTIWEFLEKENKRIADIEE